MRIELPLLVGVTGHRDLRPQDVPLLEEHLRAFYRDLKTRYPDLPLVLLSPLAEGADRLAARVARECGLQLYVPLPMPRAVYEEDFGSAESRQEFADLLHAADWVEELSWVGDTSSASAVEPDRRARQYAQVGAFVVRHCQILIALWDGKRVPEKTGGTAQVVRWQLEGLPEPYSARSGSLEASDAGPVWHLITPRRSHPSPDPPAISSGWLLPGEPGALLPQGASVCEAGSLSAGPRFASRLEQPWTEMLRCMADCNRELRESGRSPGDRIRMARDPLLGVDAEFAEALPLQGLEALFQATNLLALRHQQRTVRALVAMLALGVLSGAAFYADLLWPALPEWIRPLLLVPPALAMGIYMWARLQRTQARYLDYRALAEALRVQYYWSLAGLPDCTADHYLVRLRNELSWVRHALRNAALLQARRAAGSLPQDRGESQRLALVLRHWVAGQQGYMEKNARRQQRLERGLHACGRVLLMAGIGLFALRRQTYGTAWLSLSGLVLQLLGVVLPVYAEKRAFRAQSRQYERMARLYALAARRLQEPGKFSSGQGTAELLRALGREALDENADWLIAHRERPLEVIRTR